MESSNSQGFATPEIPFDDYNSHVFVINQLITQIQTVTLVKIVAVTNTGGVSPVGFVDVVPMVAQVDNAGNPIEHVTLYNIPYMRMQGGTDAIILDPKVGDIGICGFASRDITQIKKSRKSGTPASFRKFSYGDGLYIGGVLNDTPSQYVRFSASGIEITSPVAVVFNAPVVTINAPTITMNASTKVHINSPLLEVTGDIIDNSGTNTRTMGAMRTVYNAHYHSDPQGGNVGPPSGAM